MADPDQEIERPPASPEPNRKSQDTNRKSHETHQLVVLSKPYNGAQSGGCDVQDPYIVAQP